MYKYLKNNVQIIKEITRQKAHQFLKGISPQSEKKTDKQLLSELGRNGFVVIENFYSSNLCKEIIKEIDDQILTYRDQIWVDKHGSDHRIWGSDRISSRVKDFFEDELLVRVSKAYLESKTINGFTLAAKLTAKKDNLGSGGGWHRDSIQKQIKSIIYLNDVKETGGPFQYYRNTHRSRNKISQFVKNIFQYSITRYRNDEVLKLPEKDLKTFTAKAGTLILVDTSGVHRGKPILDGRRYALTNYYYAGNVPQHMKKQLIN